MTSLTATIAGRVIGPDGLGRLGRVTLVPQAASGQDSDQAVLANRVSARLDTDGYLVGPAGQSLIVVAGDYEIDLNIPGDLGVHLRRKVSLSPGQAFTLADLLAGSSIPPQPPTPPSGGILTPGSHKVHHDLHSDTLEAVNPVEVVDLGDGTLTWRKLDDELVRPDGRGVRDADAPGILEAIDKATVIDPGNGTLTWR
jgi:hypothetical protein